MSTTVEIVGDRVRVVLGSRRIGWVEWPILTDDGRVLWDMPELIPAFAKRKARQLLRKL